MVSADRFRSVTGSFATGVTIVTISGKEIDHGMTVNSFASVSLEPPLVLFNADISTRTHDLVEERENFAVNILAMDHRDISDRFAGQQDEYDDPFTDVSTFAAETGAPILEDSIAYIDCSLEASYDGGDHTIYLGHVEELDTLNPDKKPLTFYKGAYGSIQ